MRFRPSDLLPDPATPLLLDPQSHAIVLTRSAAATVAERAAAGDAAFGAAAAEALAEARGSYAPYSKCPAGAALVTSTGAVYAGAYLESAAYNPSLPPLQTAIVDAVIDGMPCLTQVPRGCALGRPRRLGGLPCRAVVAARGALASPASRPSHARLHPTPPLPPPPLRPAVRGGAGGAGRRGGAPRAHRARDARTGGPRCAPDGARGRVGPRRSAFAVISACRCATRSPLCRSPAHCTHTHTYLFLGPRAPLACTTPFPLSPCRITAPPPPCKLSLWCNHRDRSKPIKARAHGGHSYVIAGCGCCRAAAAAVRIWRSSRQ